MKRLLVFGSFVLLLMVATPTWAEGQDNHGSHGGSPTPTQKQTPAEQTPLQPEAPSSEMPGMTNEEHQNMLLSFYRS